MMRDRNTAGAESELSEIRLLLDKAHAAARDADGAVLRHAMEEARDRLRMVDGAAADILNRALDDLDTGKLVELDALLESVRRDLAAVD